MKSAPSTDAAKRKRLPPHVVQQYPDGGRGFKRAKREELSALNKAYGALRVGCVYFPDNGYQQMNAIEKALDELSEKLSAKAWGR